MSAFSQYPERVDALTPAQRRNLASMAESDLVRSGYFPREARRTVAIEPERLAPYLARTRAARAAAAVVEVDNSAADALVKSIRG